MSLLSALLLLVMVVMVVSHVHHEGGRSGDVLRISCLQNVCDAKRRLLYGIHSEASGAVCRPEAEIGCVKRVEPGGVHPGASNDSYCFSNDVIKRQTCKTISTDNAFRRTDARPGCAKNALTGLKL